MVAIHGRTLLEGTALESWLRRSPPHLSIVVAHGGGLRRLQAAFLVCLQNTGHEGGKAATDPGAIGTLTGASDDARQVP